MALALASPSSRWYRDVGLLGQTLSALDHWLDHGGSNGGGGIAASSNWWWASHGVALSLGVSVTLLAEHLDPRQTRAAARLLGARSCSAGTGVGVMLRCTAALQRAVLEGDAESAATAVGHALSSLRYRQAGEATGINPDGTFFTHGAQLYNGGYGAAFVAAAAQLLAWVRDTPLALPHDDARYGVFNALVLDGSQHMMVFAEAATPLWDVAVVGRTVSRPHGGNWGMQEGVVVDTGIAPALAAGVGGPRAAELGVFAALLNGSATPAQGAAALAGTRIFAAADYVVHASTSGDYSCSSLPPATRCSSGTSTIAGEEVCAGCAATPPAPGIGWVATVRMVSTRTVRCTCGLNSENRRGQHLSDGAIFLYTHGREFAHTFPAWHWGRVPGVSATSSEEGSAGACRGSEGSAGGASAFVGGVTDGVCGSAVLVAGGDSEGRVRLRRSVFFFADLYVVLGANVSSGDGNGGLDVWTTIAQRRLSGTGTFTSNSGGAALPVGFDGVLPKSTWWVWEGGVGVIIFPPAAAQEQQLHLSTAARTGDWADIGAQHGEVTVALFSLSIAHAAPVSCASFAYAVVPNVALATFVAGAARGGWIGTTILRNDASVQAVRHGGDGDTAPVVLQATLFDSSGVLNAHVGYGWNVHVAGAGAFIVSLANSSDNRSLITATVADPAHVGGLTRILLSCGSGELANATKSLQDDATASLLGCSSDGGALLITLAVAVDGTSTSRTCPVPPDGIVGDTPGVAATPQRAGIVNAPAPLAGSAASFVVMGETYTGESELALLPPVPGSPWSTHPSASSTLAVGVYLNTVYHFETLMSVTSSLLIAGYACYVWTSPAWDFASHDGRGALLRAFVASFAPAHVPLALYTGQVELDAVVVASHSFAAWSNPWASFFVLPGEPHYPRFLRSGKRLVMVLHEAEPESTRVLAEPSRANISALALPWASPALIGVPVLAQARAFLPAAPFRGFAAPLLRRFVVQGSARSSKRDYEGLARALSHPAMRAHAGSFEVLVVGAHPADRPWPLDGVPGVRHVAAQPPKRALDEAAFHAPFRCAHFLLPLQDAGAQSTYFTTRFSSSVGLAFAYRLLFVAHTDVQRVYDLPPALIVPYSQAQGGEGGNATAEDGAVPPGTLLSALLAALSMSARDYARARDAYGAYLGALDGANTAALRGALEGPLPPVRAFPEASPPPRPNATCAPERFLWGKDMPASAGLDAAFPAAHTPAACCAACLAHGACAAWVWRAEASCWLKAETSGVMPAASDLVVGLLRAAPAPAAVV